MAAIPVNSVKYRLARMQAAKRKRGAQWAAMRILREFTVQDLLAVCELDAGKRRSVLAYVGQLRRAGYLRIARRGNCGRYEPHTFRLIRNSGPRPPAIVRKAAMYDPNTEQEHPFERSR